MAEGKKHHLVSKQLELFDEPPQLNSIETKTWIEHKPLAPLTGDRSPIEFHVAGSPQQYIDLKRSRIRFKVTIVKADGSPLSADDVVAPANDFLNSLFDQVDVTLQQLNPSTSVSRHHGYKAMIDILLNGYTPQLEKTKLRAELFVKENSFNNVKRSVMYTEIFESIVAGVDLDLEGSIRSDICEMDKCIPSAVELRFKFYPAQDAFRLNVEGEKEFKVIIKSATLKICQLKLTDEELLRQTEEFEKHPAVYCFDRSDIKSFQLSQGSYSSTLENLYSGSIPKSLVIAMVSSKAYAGSFDENPYQFQTFDLNYCEVAVDGYSVPSVPIRPDFRYMQFSDVYLNLLKEGSDKLGIYYDDFRHGYALFMFDLMSEEEEDVTCRTKTGNLRITLNFSEALPHGITILIYSRFAERFTIDSVRNVIQG